MTSHIARTKRQYLNAFAGLGGNTEQIDRETWGVTHIETDDSRVEYLQTQFPRDTVLKVDAYDFILHHMDSYDFIWASPPWQSHSRMRVVQFSDRYTNKSLKYPDFRLYELIVYLMRFYRGKYVVENVIPYYTPLIPYSQKIGRHLLWSNFNIPPLDVPADNVMNTDKKLRDRINPEIGAHILYYSEHNRIAVEEWF